MTAAQARNISCQLHAKASSTRHHRDAEHADRRAFVSRPTSRGAVLAHAAVPCPRRLAPFRERSISTWTASERRTKLGCSAYSFLERTFALPRARMARLRTRLGSSSSHFLSCVVRHLGQEWALRNQGSNVTVLLSTRQPLIGAWVRCHRWPTVTHRSPGALEPNGGSCALWARIN
jgi:hypothetical protein